MAIRDNDPDHQSDSESEDALVYIGRQLREARLQRGEDLHDVADQLRIKQAYLGALEAGDLTAIPGRPYALGFYRTYANFLGFDGEQVVASVKTAESRALADPELHYRTPIVESHRPGLIALGASLLLMISVYGAWHTFVQDRIPSVQRVAALPPDIDDFALDLPEVEPDGQTTVGVVTDSGTSSGVDKAPTGADPRNRIASGDSSPSVVPQAAAEPSRPGHERRPPLLEVAGAENLAIMSRDVEDDRVESLASEEPTEPTASELLASLRTDAGEDRSRVYGDAGDNPRVVLIAEQPSWIQVRSKSRDYVRTRTLEAGDRFQLPNRDDLALWTGNAGGLTVVVDGKPIGSLGNAGEVIRDISLEPEHLLTRSRSTTRSGGP